MKAADTESTRGVLQVIEAIGLPAVLEQCAEELGDVRLCLKVLDVAMGGYNTTAVEAEKLRRWLERITQEQKNPE